MNAKLEHFCYAMKNYQDQYTLIGGSACTLIFEEKGGHFRPTVDLDIVLVVEKWTSDFASALWQYIKAGKYNANRLEQGGGHGNVYRFTIHHDSETIEQYPKQIELFSRAPDNIKLFEGAYIAPITTDEDVSNFSAILVDDDYYQFILKSLHSILFVNTISYQCITVLKAKAWIGNKQLFQEGKLPPKRESDIHKHAFDICQLLTLFDDNDITYLPPKIYLDIKEASILFSLEEEQFLLDKNKGQFEPPIPYNDVSSLLTAFFKPLEQ